MKTRNMDTPLKKIIALHQSGELEKAEALYLCLLEKQPENTDVLHLLAILNGQKKNLETALFYVKEAIRLEPNSPSFYNSLGNIYKNQGKTERAIKAYYQAIALNPNYAEALSNLGNLLFAKGEINQAILHYQTAAKLKPNSADIYCNLGLAYRMAENEQEAKKAFETSIKIDPLQASSQMELGRLAQLEKKEELAIQHYLACLTSEPDHLEARNNLGSLLLSQGKLTDAIEAFKHALSINPKHAESLANLGNAYLQAHRLNDALLYYLRLLEIQPDLESYYNLGVIYMHKEHHQDAITYFQQVLKIDSNHIDTHINLGSIYLKIEDHSKAILAYETALKLEPNHPELNYLLAALKHTHNEFEAAPPAYIQSLFDQYAPYFDLHLKECLHYQSPKALLNAVTQYTGSQTASWEILDLGCGTGLCGALFRPLAKTLSGIDLSPKMIEAAKLKGCYDCLYVESIETGLTRFRQQDLILASDVITYIGNLTSLFKKISQSIKNNGLFAFTTEQTFEADYVLQTTARFAHHPEYIKDLLQKTGFDIVVFENTLIRKHKNQPLTGHLWLAIHKKT